MKITLTFTPSELERFEHDSKVRIVVIDVLRACSTITHALAQGCKVIFPFVSVRECMKKARELGRDKVILGGERGGLRIKGFQLGNSPEEYSSEIVRGKSILFTTTNCTKNLHAITNLMKTKEILFCSFLNLPAVAEYLTARMAGPLPTKGGRATPDFGIPHQKRYSADTSRCNRGLHLALSGEEGEASLEDIVCAGMLIHRLLGAYGDTPLLSDASLLAHITYLHYKDNLHQALLDSAAGQRLVESGMEKDIDFCAQVGIYPCIPRFSRGVIK